MHAHIHHIEAYTLMLNGIQKHDYVVVFKCFSSIHGV